ncbi:MAG: DNA-directed RNA polymerase subunit beta', DNA-directed RNA polymerase subunit beta' [Candidatus Peregrinibacteria bacterium GW2011_GWF2_39_17]|nr:MAG: DNA-directed RNA polymerase subunit beta', DNA-directed RNA polymerase subunit beta' [Candidatus Peregrinibacteria bacterium GW2011_GWF2_39_17]
MMSKDNLPLTFKGIALSVASPEEILSWSHGEVKKPETINYRTQKPERDGLFCEKIFGPTKNWECYCGKYKRIRYKGVICEKCGVEVTRSIVRRERMGHIKLAVPVTHIWFLRSTPSRIGLLLNLPVKTLEQVVYFAAYVITEVDEKAKEETFEQLKEEFKNYRIKIQKEFKEKNDQVEKSPTPEKLEKEMAAKIEELTMQHNTAREELQNIKPGHILTELSYRDMSMKFGHVFKAGTGAESLREVIKNTDLTQLKTNLEEQLKKASGQKHKKLTKRLKLVGSFLKATINPEWMIITILPVIPPDLRPMVQLDGGRFAASDLNDLYRRVINRNNRLKRLLSIGAPEVICRNEKRMLQEAVDALLNNSARQSRAVFNTGDKRKLRSLSDMLKGKQGRFRQNLLGKRVDYSGRSVIVVGPHLKLHQCGLPKTMALELFKPFVIGQLIGEGYAHNIKNAERLILSNKREVWDILEKITKDHYVLLNRAPTLHRLGIQSFQAILVEGKAIMIHPLVCAAFNADFDGDQMAVHVPLSRRAQEEAKGLMLSANNLLKPSAGEPIVNPTQDMVLGCYFLTQTHAGKKGEGMIFADPKEAFMAYELEHLNLQAIIKVRIKGEIIETSVGRLIFNEILPDGMAYINEALTKKSLLNIIASCYNQFSYEITAQVCDAIKKMGFEFATKSGISISAADMIVPKSKEKTIEAASEVVKKINNQYWKGLVTDRERYHQTIKVWAQAKSDITKSLFESFPEENDILYSVASGARGNWGQITQLCGIKGLVANPAGETIELPIRSNLKEGFTILEYFIATHGGRKGKSDTALKTAEAGYLTRRLVDAVQDIVVKEKECGSKREHEITVEQSEKIGEDFEKRIFGRVLASDLKSPAGKVLAKRNTEIDHKLIATIKEMGITTVQVRNVITCQTQNGICQMCYGRDLGTNLPVDLGTAVGIIAAQSIGEPGTQLTMRTFHMGGVAEGSDITQGLTRVEELLEARPPKIPALLAKTKGHVKISRKGKYSEIVILSDEVQEKSYLLPEKATVKVKVNQAFKAKDTLAENKETKMTVKAEESGRVVKIQKDRIIIISDEAVEEIYKIPAERSVLVKNGDLVSPGQALSGGHKNLRELMGLADIHAAQHYILSEVQSIYASQGQKINDKHIEIIVRQMFSKVRIQEAGDSNFLPGEIVDLIIFEKTNGTLKKAHKKESTGERLLLGLTRISLQTDSWLSAASFQETIRVLVEAATTKKIDYLEGLKENVIIGKLIPAGATYRKTHGIHKEEKENEN